MKECNHIDPEDVGTNLLRPYHKIGIISMINVGTYFNDNNHITFKEHMPNSIP